MKNIKKAPLTGKQAAKIIDHLTSKGFLYQGPILDAMGIWRQDLKRFRQGIADPTPVQVKALGKFIDDRIKVISALVAVA
jgi:hypothetical protein